ncbi:SNF2 family N-terminal domain-containing protein [Truncatella angustata]|uniref:SNF2 family N-terminal domain-containing protein n=1 Tax=Truncatella angustata TaxID=152316 RepID=A0A9P9A3C3_9PEZI|nr:SNF2 family N-terminal domain-containing protein [Truncatella angustata]KAH6659105.1 SNF2 family N-terminal domain-containing protein [Truncatella angustata]
MGYPFEDATDAEMDSAGLNVAAESNVKPTQEAENITNINKDAEPLPPISRLLSDSFPDLATVQTSDDMQAHTEESEADAQARGTANSAEDVEMPDIPYSGTAAIEGFLSTDHLQPSNDPAEQPLSYQNSQVLDNMANIKTPVGEDAIVKDNSPEYQHIIYPDEDDFVEQDPFDDTDSFIDLTGPDNDSQPASPPSSDPPIKTEPGEQSSAWYPNLKIRQQPQDFNDDYKDLLVSQDNAGDATVSIKQEDYTTSFSFQLHNIHQATKTRVAGTEEEPIELSSDSDDDDLLALEQPAISHNLAAFPSGSDLDEGDSEFPDIQQMKYGIDMDELRKKISAREQIQLSAVSSKVKLQQRLRLQKLDDEIKSERKRLNSSDDAEISIFISGSELGSDTKEDGKGGNMTRNHQGPRAKNASEWFEKYGHIANFLGGSRKRRSSNPDHGLSKNRVKKTRAKSTTAQRQAREKLFETLLNHDPIKNRRAWGGVSATVVKASNKKDKFKQLREGAGSDYTDAASDERRLKLASQAFGDGQCKPNNDKWILKGMKTTLLDHQVVGGAWMLQREFGVDGLPRGGLVADEMGMGKTVLALTCIVSNQAQTKDLVDWSKTTLIVVPSSALPQWKQEIKKHAGDTLKHVMQFKSSAHGEDAPGVCIRAMDIVMVTYNEVASEYPSEKFRKELSKRGLSQKYQEKQIEEATGPLFKVPFWRIILDEVDNIKNRKTRTSLACLALQGRHRWGMSGTPLHNSIHEFYPYLNFIGLPAASTYQNFVMKFGNIQNDDVMVNFETVLPDIMLRRTSSDKFMGKPYFVLPDSHDGVMRIELSGEERVIYREIEISALSELNDILSSPKSQSIKKCAFEFLNYLRMATAHPFLLEGLFRKVFQPENIGSIQKQLKEIGGRQPLYQQIRSHLGNLAKHTGTGVKFGKGNFGYHFDMDSQLELARAAQREDVCRICLDYPMEPKQAECEHVFCSECIKSYIADVWEKTERMPRCPECSRLINGLKRIEMNCDMEDNEPTKSTPPSATSKYPKGRGITLQEAFEAAETPSSSKLLHKDGRQLGDDILGYQPRHHKFKTRFFTESDKNYPEKPMTPSSKATAIKATALEWLTDAPDDKIIIFSLFTKMMRVIGRMLQDEEIPFIYFDGSLSAKQKKYATDKFSSDPNAKVMIMSLKSGGVALNLTCANRVIMSDLWWNHSVEMQAFGRVYRYGQTKQTYYRCIVANDTIDQRLEELQAHKSEQIEKVMKASKWQDLPIETIASLFGRVTTDDSGNIRVTAYADESDDDD